MHPVPEALAERNHASWREMIGFYEEFLRSPKWAFVAPLARLVRQVAESELARSFRAGQSMWHLIVSTAEQHGLKADEPFVAVTLVDNGAIFELEYRPGTGGRAVEKQRCQEPEARAHLERMLAQLWTDSREPTAAQLPDSARPACPKLGFSSTTSVRADDIIQRRRTP